MTDIDVPAVARCPTCRITVLASSDNPGGYCSQHMQSWIEWWPDGVDKERYEVQMNANEVSTLADKRYRFRVRSNRADFSERPWWRGLPPSGERRNATRTETEFNMNWARSNPELFIDSLRRFGEEHSADDWETHIHFRDSFAMTLIATKRG